MSCGSIGSGIQAVGAAVELWALLGIVWQPWLRPRFLKARSTVEAQVRRLWPFTRRKDATVHLDAATVKSSASIDTRVIRGGPEDDPNASPEDRIELLVRRVATLEERQDETEKRFDDELNKKVGEAKSEARAGHEALSGKVAEIERTALQIRVKDALRLLAGVALSLLGASWGAFC